jgi:RHS repeat-associated protein
MGTGVGRRILAALALVAAALAVAGRGSADAAVAPSGAFVTEVPIEVPHYHGLEPPLQLAYHSQLGNGPLGMGWELEGLSSIRRASPGLGAPRYDASDEYFLDGLRLVPCARAAASPSCKYPASPAYEGYAASIESFRRIAYDPASRRWVIWEKDGRQETYEPDVRRLADGTVGRWRLAKVRDTSGNEVAYSYRTDGSVSYPLAISYGGMNVRFYYETRPDVVETGIGDRLAELRLRLKTIDVLAGPDRARSYALRYRMLAGSRRSALVEVQRYGTDATLAADGTVTSGHRLAPVRLQYPGRAKPGFDPAEELSPMTAPGWEAPAPPNAFRDRTRTMEKHLWKRTFHTADVDGDGRSDAVLVTFTGVSEDETRVHFATEFADGNNVSTSLVFPVHAAALSWAADLDADGRSDFVFLWWDRLQANGPLIIHLIGALSLGDGTFRLGATAQVTEWIDHAQSGWLAHCQPGDMNGDGRSDFVCSYADNDGGEFIGTAFSRGDGTFSSTQQQVPVGARYGTFPLAVGDVDADGLDDVQLLDVLPPEGGCPDDGTCDFSYEPLTGFSIGGGEYRFVRVPAHWNTGQYDPTIYSADLNGDGRADYLSFAGATFDEQNRFLGRIRTAISRPTGGFDLVGQDVPAELANVENVVSIGDADGDGRTDLLVMTPVAARGGLNCAPTAYVRPALTLVRSLGDGTFDLPARWDDCAHSQVLDDQWDNIAAPPEIQAADTNGDGLADFLTRFIADHGSDTTITVRDEVSQPRGRDTFRWVPAELNGDGREDLLYISPQKDATRLHSLLRQANGTYTQVSTPVAAFANPARVTWKVLDVNGDGREDVVHLQCVQPSITPRPCITRVDTFLADGNGGWTSKGSSSFVWSVLDRPEPVDWRPADVNGDEAIDLVALEWSRGDGLPEGLYVRALLSDGKGGWTAAPFRGPFAPPPSTFSFDTRNWGMLDVDGDGRTDLVHLVTSRMSIRVTTLLARGDSDWEQRLFARTQNIGDGWTDLDIVSDTTDWRSIDANGDGLGDLVHLAVTAKGLRVHTLLSNGDANFTQERADVAMNVKPVSDRLHWLVGNPDGDGRGDLVHARLRGTRVSLTMLASTGDGGWRLRHASAADPGASGNRAMRSWRIADADGDGRSDLVRVDRPLPGQSGAPHLRVSTLSSDAPLELLTHMTDELGATTAVAYAPSSRFVLSQPAQGCGVPAGVVFQVATSETVRDGRTSAADETFYGYACARWSRSYRSMLGWTDVAARRPGTPSRAESRTYRRYLQTEQCRTQLQDVGFRDLAGGFVGGRDLLSYTAPGSAPPYSCLLSSQRHLEYGGPTTALNSVTRYAYDEFGNVVDVFDDGTPGASDDDRTTIVAFHPAVAPWLVGLPAWEGLFEGVQPAKTMRRSTFFCYDGANGSDTASCPGVPTKGMLTGVQAVDDLGLFVRSTRGYDAYGNAAAAMGPRHFGAAAFYDSTFHLYPETVCNALSQCVQAKWNPALGTIEKLTDANQKPTSFEFDELGRMTRATYPGGKIIQEKYLDWGDPRRQRVHEQINDGTADGLWSDTYFDGLGRVYRVVKEGDAPGKTFVQLTQYADASQAPYRQSEWFRRGSTKHGYETFEYDGVGRLTRQTHPDGTYISFGYGSDGKTAWSTVTDERRHSRTTYVDAQGRVTRIRDTAPGIDASTTTTYDAADRPLTMADPNGNVTTWTWDLLGRLRKIDDPDLGRRSYTYDLGGNLETVTDAKGNEIRFTYDALDRRKTKTYPNGAQVVWNYDEPSHGAGIGQLTSVSDPSAASCPQTKADTFDYDPAGHIVSWGKCISGRSQTFGFDYDTLGRRKQVTYPDGEAVQYEYDSAGRLAKVPGYVDKLAYDAAGRKTQIAYANGVVTDLRYSRPRRWLDRLTLKHGTQSLLNVTYTHEPNGLVHSSSSARSTLSYSYDGLDRLTSVTGPQAETFHYDDAGNMLSNSSVGTYTYPVQGPNACLGSWPRACGPHAARQAGPLTLGYDANGDLSSVLDTTTGKSKGIDWTYDHQPEWLSDFDGAVTHYTHDWSGLRVSRERGTGTTRYYGDLLDVSSTTLGPTKYYWADGLLIASRNSAGVTWYHGDLLGSTRLLTDQGGAIVGRNDYKAFGVATSTPNGERGFAGYRGDADNALLHVGERDYDPQLGRFISPDPLVPDDGGSQAPNRYAYVNNEPIANVDADGHQPTRAVLDPRVEADVRSVVTPEELNRFRRNPFTLEGLSMLVRGLDLYTHPDTTPPELRTDRIIRNMSVAAGYAAGLGQNTTKGLADGNLSLDTVREEGVQNLLAVAGFALRGVAMYRATVAETAGFRAWAATAPNASLLNEIGAVDASGRRISLFNPTNGTRNCVQCVTALIDTIQNGSLVEQAYPAFANEGKMGRALEYMTEHTGVTFGKPGLFAKGGTIPAEGRYVVFTRLDLQANRAGHVMYGETLGDLTWFYDPQTDVGRPFLDEPFIAYPIHFEP